MNAEHRDTLFRAGGSAWRRTEKLTLILLLAWAGVTLAVIFFARELSAISLFGWPVSFYMAAQGTLLVYLGIVALFAWRMRRIDQLCKDDDHGK